MNSTSKFSNVEMAEVYGRLSEALDMTVEHKKHPSRLLIHDEEHVFIGIEPQDESLSARGRTKFDNIEIEANAKCMAKEIKNKLNSSYFNSGGDDA